MKKSIFLALLLIASLGFAAATIPAPPWNNFGFSHRKSDDGLMLKAPSIVLTSKEKQKLISGKSITRLMDAPGGYKIGYLRFFAPFDPVTAYMVISDVDNYDHIDPIFGATGSISEKKRTLLPNAFECNTCVEKGEYRASQLIVLPLMSPRQVCLAGNFDTRAFPWESHWDLASDKQCCESRKDPEFKDLYDKAVFVTRNKEAWHISPLPKAFQKTPEDVMRADCIYTADINPGGDLEKMNRIAKLAAKMSLPQLAKHVIARGTKWESFLAARYGPGEVKKYKKWVEQYRKAVSHNSPE
jgi:hypothetical protein